MMITPIGLDCSYRTMQHRLSTIDTTSYIPPPSTESFERCSSFLKSMSLFSHMLHADALERRSRTQAKIKHAWQSSISSSTPCTSTFTAHWARAPIFQIALSTCQCECGKVGLRVLLIRSGGSALCALLLVICSPLLLHFQEGGLLPPA